MTWGRGFKLAAAPNVDDWLRARKLEVLRLRIAQDDNFFGRLEAAFVRAPLGVAYAHRLRSSVRYWIASPIWSARIDSEFARSAIVLATFRIRSYALALKFSSVIAIFIMPSAASSSWQ